jgi:hypothetical protein
MITESTALLSRVATSLLRRDAQSDGASCALRDLLPALQRHVAAGGRKGQAITNGRACAASLRRDARSDNGTQRHDKII